MPPAVHFSIACDAAWAPGIETREAWLAWSQGRIAIGQGTEPRLQAMPPMQRRRAGFLGKMALEVAFACLGQRSGVPVVFCSRHGEVSRSVELLRDLAAGEPLSPTAFGLSVHNAIAGMFSIARGDRAHHLALSGGAASVEHAVIEACGLLADGEQAVLLVVYDCPLPAEYADYREDGEQPYAWAWLMEAPRRDVVSLSWSPRPAHLASSAPAGAGLDVLRFQLRGERSLERISAGQRWLWTRDA
jgi:hypothetical protein